MAELAGVSVGTVSNVLNHPALVSAATREKVQDAIRQLGFVRNESARQLRAGRSRSLGLIVLDVANPFFTDVARGVEDLASEAAMAVILCNSDEDLVKEERYLALLEEQRVQGILITPVNGVDARLRQLRDRGTPVVLVDRQAPASDQCSVAVDDVLGGRMAVGHLVDQGHRRIAFVGGPDRITQVRDRRQGAIAAVEAAGLESTTVRVFPTASLTVSSGVAAAQQILDVPARRRPTAVFCANDLVALGVLQEMTRREVRVPQDVAIVGYDDIDFAASAAVPLSSVRQPRRQLGRTASQLLLEEASRNGDHQHRQVVFQPELIVRRSSELRRRHPGSR